MNRRVKVDATSKVFTDTNWSLLAEQKLSLIECIGVAPSRQHPVHLQGILNWIDSLQDAAEAEGYPVVWLDIDK